MKCSPPKERTAMHELAICQALITQVEDIAVQRTAWVRQVRVGVGPLSGIERSCWKAHIRWPVPVRERKVRS